jgi:hypothetical protein
MQVIVPLPATQQAPVAGGEQMVGLHTDPAPWNVPPAAAHCASVVGVQPPFGPQHAPMEGVPQVVLAQVVPAPWKVPPPAAHWAAFTIAQPPFAPQHAPNAPHAVAEHCVPTPWNVPPPFVHWVCVAITQEPFGKQHAPVVAVWQVVLVHVVPGPWNVPPFAAHCASVVTVQKAGWFGVAGTQHAPVGAVCPNEADCNRNIKAAATPATRDVVEKTCVMCRLKFIFDSPGYECMRIAPVIA